MVSVTKRFEFDAAHRLHGYDGLCANLHGHRYVAEVTVAGELDDQGMVIDFSGLSATVGEWIMGNWDHRVLICYDDRVLEGFLITAGQRYYAMRNPTAENMAAELLAAAQRQLEASRVPATVARVRIWETPDSWAEVTT